MTAIGTFHNIPLISAKRGDYTRSTMKKPAALEQSIPVSKIYILEGGKLPHHSNPAQMTATGELRCQPGLDDIQGKGAA